jgi:hypothetical protein
MANFYGKDRDVDFAASKLMSFGKSFSRMNGQPLDESEVWYDKAALEAFAAGNSAYVGMKLVYVDETNQKVYQYSVQYDGSIKEIGVAPLGDSKSIVVDAETGTVSLKGIDSLVFEREIEGGEKEDIQYQPLMTKNGLVWVEPSKTTVEGLATLIEALTARVKANEDAIGIASKPETTEGAGDGVAATGLHKKIEDEVARALAAEAVLDGKIAAIDFVDADELATAIKDFATVTYVDGEIDKVEEAISNLNHFTAKVVIDKAEMKDTGVLYLFKIDSATGSDVYEEYIVIDGVATLIGDTTTDLSNYYNKTEIDGKVETLESAINDEVDAREALAEKVTALENIDNATQEELNAYKGEVTEALGNKADKATTLAGYGITDAYTAAQTDAAILAKIGEMTGGESAADVLGLLNAYKAANDREVWGDEFVANHTVEGVYTPEYTGDSRVDKAIKEVKTVDNAKIKVTTSTDRTVTIDDSDIITLIDAAQSQADKGVQDAASAASAASAAQGTANQGVSDAAAAQAVADNAKAIADENKAAIAAHATEFSTLKGRVDAHDTAIAEKAAQSALDAANTAIGTNAGKISTLEGNVATINEGLNNRYTKSETDSAIKAITGTPAEGKTLVKMIEDLAAEAYDDTEVRGLISDNTTAIENITKAETGAIAVAVKAETERATGVESGLDDRLKEVETFFAAVETPDTVIDTLAEIVSYIESDKSGAAELTGKVNKNTEDIDAVTKRVVANETAISTTLPNAIANAIKETEDYTDAEIAKVNVLATIEAITGEDDVVTKTAKKGLILPEVDKFEMTDGKVTAISTDLLKNGSMTLVLNGGTAKG